MAINGRSRSAHLSVRDEGTGASARAFLEEALAAFPFRVTHVLTDRGSCSTAEGFERACGVLVGADRGPVERRARRHGGRANR